MTSKLVVSSASYPQTSSQLPYKEVSAAATATRFILTRSSSRMSSRAMPQKRSSTVSEDRNFSTSMSVATLLDKSKSQTSTAVSAKSTKSEITSTVIVSTFICEGRG